MKYFYTFPLAAAGLLLAHLLTTCGLVLLWVTAHSPYFQGFTFLVAALYNVLQLVLVLPRVWARLKRWR